MTTLAMRINILSPTNEMQFTDVKSSLRTVYHLSDSYGSTNRIIMTTLAMKINILSPTNEMQFTDRKKFFTDRISLLRSVRSVPIEKPYMSTLAMKILMRCTNEMQFTDRKRPFTDCMPYLNPYGPYGS